MNMVYALMIVTTMGVTEAPNPFSTLSACEKVSAKIEKSYCVEKKNISPEDQLRRMMAIMKEMTNEN